jgi:hypothetical protein
LLLLALAAIALDQFRGWGRRLLAAVQVQILSIKLQILAVELKDRHCYTCAMRIKPLANATIKPLGYQFQRVRKLNPDSETFAALLGLRGRNGDFIQFCADHYGQSRAQLFQDLFALWATEQKTGGYFVEFGATNGVDINNTHLLENSYGWKGTMRYMVTD